MPWKLLIDLSAIQSKKDNPISYKVMVNKWRDMARLARPLYRNKNGNAELVASGFLYLKDDRKFLISAAHAADDAGSAGENSHSRISNMPLMAIVAAEKKDDRQAVEMTIAPGGMNAILDDVPKYGADLLIANPPLPLIAPHIGCRLKVVPRPGMLALVCGFPITYQGERKGFADPTWIGLLTTVAHVSPDEKVWLNFNTKKLFNEQNQRHKLRSVSKENRGWNAENYLVEGMSGGPIFGCDIDYVINNNELFGHGVDLSICLGLIGVITDCHTIESGKYQYEHKWKGKKPSHFMMGPSKVALDKFVESALMLNVI